MKTISLFVLPILICCSCQEETTSHIEIYPISVSQRYPIADSDTITGTFFQFSEKDGKYTFYDGQLDKIGVLNQELKLLNLFGKRGEGPGQYANPPLLWNRKGLILAIDRSRIITYDLEGNVTEEKQAEIPLSFFSIDGVANKSEEIFYIASPGPQQILGIDSAGITKFEWGELLDFRSSTLVLASPIRNDQLFRIGTNDGIILRLDTTGKTLDSLSLSTYSPFQEWQKQVDQQFGERWSRTYFPIVSHAEKTGRFIVLRLMTPPSDGSPVGFGNFDANQWMVLSYDPFLQIEAIWETSPENKYSFFVIAPDGRSLIAYEAERGEFHRLPFPEGFGER